MRLPKKETERRHQVAIDYFMQNVNATGESFNKALQDGTLTGKKEPALNIRHVYDYRTEARKLLAAGEKPPALPATEFEQARHLRTGAQAVATRPPFVLSGTSKALVQSLIREMSSWPSEVTDITIGRNGQLTLGQMTRQEVAVEFESSGPAKG